MYAIIDIETTGGSYKVEKITEIAVYVHDGQQIVDEFVSLINPEKLIPYYITQITGITNEMVATAPKFYEVAKKIVEITKGHYFVGHNVNFDYSFVKNEFKMLGYEYKRKTLCTVRLSRKIIPGLKSYSLGNLCNDLKIPINDRHRAAGDAIATVKLFDLLLELKPDLCGALKEKVNYGHLKPILDKLPAITGVYYFYDSNNDIIYIGKSTNIHDRVIQHLNNTKSRRAVEMVNKIADISYTQTGSELVALLLESNEIKQHKPLYNRAQRRSRTNFSIYPARDKLGYICFEISRSKKKNKPLASFESSIEAKNYMERLAEKYQLCHKLCGLYENSGACFHYSIKQCLGACIGEEHPMIYNQRATIASQEFTYSHENIIIIDKGRNETENAAVVIEKGKYLGFGYFDNQIQVNDIEYIKDSIKPFDDNHDVKQIIRVFLKNNKVEQIIKY